MNLKDITLAYGNNVVAHIENAELLSGELVCLVGRNGSGKSTLIRYLLNRDNDPKEMAVVLTDRIDIDRMTMRDVVAMGRMPYTGFFGSLSDEDRRIVDEAMETLGISKFADRLINTLSDGERQKAMIAKALAQETPYILLDEPTAYLDYPSKVSTMQLLKKLAHEQNKAILISTHDIEVSMRYCDKVWWMKEKTLQTLSPENFNPSLI
ncbi:MAG: ABC transporter ATP-binding protein [Prevotella sp.]|nr:ABC transporter ATP-binding protein [Prevotella sp.]